MHRPAPSALLALIVSVSLSTSSIAQAPPPSFEVARRIDTGWVANEGPSTRSIASFPVRVAGSSWIRLAFDVVRLPEAGAKLVITSVADGAEQVMSARNCREWGFTSAYFNGEDVQVEIVAEPASGPCRVVLSTVTAGVPPFPSVSQCGTTDDRVPSSDPRAARVMPVGCSVWMIDDCSHNFLTAGHCMTGGLQTVQFNVPLSNASGSLNHPPPQDQYAVDVASKQSMNAGVGNDWGYFGVFPNTNTGLRPFQKQQTAYVRASAAPAVGGGVTIRVTGYGTDSTPPQNNQAQQTSTGTYTSHVASQLSYRADTEGGNSGAPVIWEEAGVAIGIHSHGGCTQSGGANSGTAIEHFTLQTAMKNPLGQCVCRGESNKYCTGKVNSQGCLQTIGSLGTPSASGGAGSFRVTASQILNHKFGFLFYGTEPENTPFQGGTRCIGGVLKRTPMQISGGNPGAPDCSGVFDYDMGARIASGLDASLVVGANVFAQYFTRDPASASGPYGLTDALQFTIGP